MFKPLLAVWKGRWYKKLVLIISLILASLYPIHRNYDHGLGAWQYDRHIRFLASESDFFNPWQYRILCPLIVEGVKWGYDHSIDRWVPLDSVIHFDPQQAANTTDINQSLLNNKDALIYLIIFTALRFAINVLIYLLTFSIFACFTRNNWLNALGVLLVSLAMGNAVYNSDLALNTYLDLLLFLWMACIVLYKGNDWWILSITILGALNRETALLIPGLYFLASVVDTSRGKPLPGIKWLRNPTGRTWTITAVSVVAFLLIFIAIRLYYGFRPPGMQEDYNLSFGWTLIKINAFSRQALRTYSEIYGVLGFLPFICLLTFRYNSMLLRVWAVVLVPAWIGLHFVTSVAGESRYYIVTLILVLVPMLLEMIRRAEPQSSST
ncbi:hypothetical protein HB364_00370 [Pseudoflavitalea sp. X16]|uniref:hypothetical protein n=1 Tax=Paraflavitalea devenefica TaxID=2716334 RepID=UPI00141DFB36|nr:hypothetical protein [Paraflavitalea devenefica]NII23513.1 hypothetical protein [Paraflavitalea devenefica]